MRTDKTLVVILVVVLVCSFAAGVGGYILAPRSAQPTLTPEETSPLEKVAFTRTGVTLFLKKATDISTIRVFDAVGREISSQEINMKVERALVDFAWMPIEKYQIQISTKDDKMYSTNCYSPTKPSPIELGVFDVKGVAPGNNMYTTGHWMGNPPSSVKISPNNKYVAVVAEVEKTAIIYLLDLETQKELWSKSMEDVDGFCIEFSSNSDYLLAGTQSREASIYCFDAATGAEKWKYICSEVGSGERSPRTWPSVWEATVDLNNKAYFLASRAESASWEEEGKPMEHNYFNTTAYCFDVSSGEKLWSFPEGGTMDYGDPSDLMASEDGEYVFLVTGGHTTYRTHDEGTIFCLDGSSGSELWRYSVSPDDGYLSSSLHGSISPDGKYVAASTAPGKALLFDNLKIIETGGDAKPLWEKSISPSILVDGVFMRSSNTWTYINGESVLFHAYTFFSRDPSPTAPPPRPEAPVEHPYSYQLQIFHLNGTLLQRYRYEGYAAPDAFAVGKYVAVPVRQTIIPDSFLDNVPRNTLAHGVYVFNLDQSGSLTEKLDWFYHTNGVVENAAISSDCKYIVIVELPIDMDPNPDVEQIVGSYKVHFLT
jgi:outer membrane protein assembly factor BamB